MKRGQPLTRRTRIKPMSDKRRAQVGPRQDVVAAVLAAHPFCQARGCRKRSTDCHEPGKRSQGADILDPEQCLALCRDHHRWAHLNPTAAVAAGLLWQRGEVNPL